MTRRWGTCRLTTAHMTSTDLRAWLLILSVALGGVAGCRSATPAPPTPPPNASSSWPRSYTDALGHTVVLKAAPRRIVSLSPAITEMLFALGAGDRVVGVTEYCDYPPEATRLPTVGAYTGFSVERVLSLNPDLVLAMRGTSRGTMDAVRRAGVSVLAYDPASVEDILKLMEDLAGMILDKEEKPEVLQRLRARVEAVRTQGAHLSRRPRVLAAVQVEPLYAVGPRNHIDDMIRLAGGENVAGDAATSWPQYSLERVLEKDPEVIVVPRGPMGEDNSRQESPAAVLRKSGLWAGTTAVKTHAIVEVEDDLLTLPGPRVVEGLEQIAAAVQRAARMNSGALHEPPTRRATGS